MVPYDKDKYKNDDFEYLNKHKVAYNSSLMNVKNLEFREPKFEYSGACSGCGETAYIKNLTQVFQKK